MHCDQTGHPHHPDPTGWKPVSDSVLPGTLSEKIDPYFRPLYDALHDMMDPGMIPKLMTAGVIEVAPLAYMRGRRSTMRSSSSTRLRIPPPNR